MRSPEVMRSCGILPSARHVRAGSRLTHVTTAPETELHDSLKGAEEFCEGVDPIMKATTDCADPAVR